MMGRRSRPTGSTLASALACCPPAILLLLVSAMGCAPAGDAPTSIVLVTLDTTRADHLGPYGYARARTPNLDRFAAEAVLYEHAYATSSWTLASHASILTGLLPMQHGAQAVKDASNHVLGYGVRPLSDRMTTLAELLRARGYRTGAVVAGPALRSELGTAQGFERYDDRFETREEIMHGKRAEEVSDSALELLESFGDAPYFLFVNYFDPHAPYIPPPPWEAGLETGSEESSVALTAYLRNAITGAAPEPLGEAPSSVQRAVTGLLAGYDAEIAYMDSQLGRVLAAVDSAPQAERTLVIITGDHGESFGEHYYFSHGAHLYEDNVRAPLMVRAPGGPRGVRIGEWTQNHRIFATVLQAAGIPIPEHAAGRPLDATEEDIVLEVQRSDSNVQMFGERFDRDLMALIQPPFKLIRSSRGKRQLYDLSQDAAELHDLSAQQPERVEAMALKLRAIELAHPGLYEHADRVELRPETEEALRALGYID